MASKKQIEAGGAFVRIFADDSPLRRALKDASQRIKNFAKPFIGAGKLIGGALTTVTVVVVGLTKKFANYADVVGDAAARTGLSAQTLSELGYAAQLSGSNVEDLEKAFRVFQKQLVSGANANVLKNLGIDAKSIRQASPDAQLNTIIAALAKIQDPTQKAAMAMQVFGKAGANLVPLLNEGEAGIVDLRAEAQRLGVSLSDEQAAAGQAFNDVLDKMSAALLGISTKIGGAVAPMLTWLADQVIIAANSFGDWLTDVLKFVGSFETAMATLNLAFVKTWTSIMSVEEAAINTIIIGINDAAAFWIDVFDQTGAAISANWSGAMAEMVTAVHKMAKSVIGPLSGILENAGIAFRSFFIALGSNAQAGAVGAAIEKATAGLKATAQGIDTAAPAIAEEQRKKQKITEEQADARRRANAVELANFRDKQNAELAAREKSRQAEVEQATKALMDSMANDQAKAQEAAKRRAEKAQMGMALAIGDVGGGTETAGTFTAAAISGLGASSLQADMLKAMQDVASNTTALLDEVAAGGLQP